nr:MAG: ORF1 [TTV-like mini virus]
MPYYYRRRYNTRRRFRWWRPRKTFRRTFWRRRRRRRVRKKLKKIHIQQWQPHTIRRLKIKGLMPLFLCNHERIANNLMQYEQSFVPEHMSGGGGFSITKYSLAGLYEQHELIHNWWTTSNDQLPLIKYSGCKFKLYYSDNVDYVFTYQNSSPMLATENMYLSTQPSAMMLHKNKIIMPSKRTFKHKKPYKTIRISPPTQLKNEWYFQQDLNSLPLLLTMSVAASFDHYYISSFAESTNISFTCLNTTVFNLHNFLFPPTTGYIPKDKYYLWASNTLTTPTYGDLIYLGETPIRQAGNTVQNTHTDGNKTKAETYFSSWKNWGNPFYHTYLNEDEKLWVTNKSPTELYMSGTQWKKDSQLTETVTNITQLSQPLTIRCRYNPMRDKGYGNSIYLVSVLRDTQAGWQKPADTNLITEGYPLWLLTWGWLDWQRKLARVQQIDDNYIVCVTSNAIKPTLPYYVFIDDSMKQNKSPYMPEDGQVLDEDNRKWYPKTKFQTVTLNNICKSGPGTPKLEQYKTVEGKCQYTFYFKVGGNPAQMEKIKDPADQGKWPIPNTNNFFLPNSLQSPATPIQYFLYNFDQKKDFLTKSALERIKTNWGLTESLFTDQRTSAMDCPPEQALQTLQELQNEEEEKEEAETSLFQQLQQQRRKQHQLKLRILQLIQQNIE